MQQSGDYPLFYFPVLIQDVRFKAEKFCRSHFLDFGVESSMLSYMMSNYPNFPKNMKLWTSDVEVMNATAKNRTVACKVFKMRRGNLTTELENCDNPNFFICMLPELCHEEMCASRCTGQKCKEFKSKEDCTAECMKPNCGNEITAKFGYKSSDGELFEKCGYQYLVSKSVSFSPNAARMFCCTKQMSLIGLYSEQESKCLAAELIRRKLHVRAFWTSANVSATCSDTYFWCNFDGSAEIIDSNLLPNNPDTSKKLAAQVDNATGSIVYEFESSSSLRRVICKRVLPQRCTESVCIPVGCELEYKENLKRKFTPAVYRPGCVYVNGCNRIYDVSTVLKETQFQAAKYACANFDVNTTFCALETKEEFDCLLKVFKANNIKSGQYYVSASSFGCPRSVRWCNERDNPLMEGPHIQWEEGEPSMDPSKECVYARYNNDKNQITFGKINCAVNLWYIKESEPIYTNNSFGLD
ncbi:Hypothetical predicted protein [Cloeon dipterum]|uniref:C-type lectin domain-containing protein n=1 Tax=Cloeon dipterum TaxID=197152 RepID=A0A8S1DPH7_9INSE|nr:Hypothetical predicted protein [Cloeon dipterum]